MATLTKEEKLWVKKLNKLLADCPSKRIAFATIGDCDVTLYDVTYVDAISEMVDKNGGEFISAGEILGANFSERLIFPNQVESTAG